VNHPRPIAALLVAISLFAAMGSTAGPKAAAPKALAPAPTLTKLVLPYTIMMPLPDGRLIGIFTSGPDVFARYSSDGGRTWTAHDIICPLPKDAGIWACHNVVVDRQGELHLILTNDDKTTGKPTGPQYNIWTMRSTNGRKNWTPPILLRKGYHGSMLSAIALKSGRIVLPICYLTKRTWGKRGEGADAYTWMGTFSSGVLYTDDGDHWKESSIEIKTPTPYIGADGIIEPIALELKDGRVWLLLRTQMGRLFESFSKDGAVWTKPQPTSIFSSDSPPSLTRLKDGRIVLLWNNALRFAYAQGGRHIMHGAVSEDEGKTWHGYREVASNPFIDEPPPTSGDHGVSYIIPIATPDSEVIAPVSVGGPEGLLLMRINPDWLYGTSQKTDFSSGAEGWHWFGTRGPEVVSHPEKSGAKALRIRKPESDWPSAATWNFPNGKSGSLQMRLKLNPGFGGARIGLTDHFSVPFDPEEQYFNLFNLTIGAEGRLQRSSISREEWHTVRMDWNCAKLECRVSVDGRPAETLPMQRRTAGVNYLRITSTADSTDTDGMWIESVEASVTP
jgi:hypothetical protein